MPKKILTRAAYLGFLGGLGLLTALIAYQGFTEVAVTLTTAGGGLILVALFHLIPLLADTLGWYCLLDPTVRPPLRTLLWARWIGESINGLLPVAQVGGDLVKARLITQRGVPGPLAGASVVVDLTVAVFTQIVFTVLGLGLLVLYLGGTQVVLAILVGLIISILLLGGFYLVQRRGLFTGLARALERLASGRDWLSLVGGARALDAAVIRLYQNPRALGYACGWRLLGWIVGTGEVWLALYFLGSPVSLFEALLLESLGQAVRASAFAIPGALGVQEGGYLVLGGVLGLGPEVSLALSLSKRVRELLLGLPGLVVWQISEGQRLWQRSADSVSPEFSSNGKNHKGIHIDDGSHGNARARNGIPGGNGDRDSNRSVDKDSHDNDGTGPDNTGIRSGGSRHDRHDPTDNAP